MKRHIWTLYRAPLTILVTMTTQNQWMMYAWVWVIAKVLSFWEANFRTR